MSKHHATDGTYTVNEDNDITYLVDGDPTRNTVVVRSSDLPLDPQWTAIELNKAFNLGVKAAKEDLVRFLNFTY
jgi:hypothetical protein